MNAIDTARWTTEQRDLWARLCAFDLDEAGASLDFSRRLARDNGWTYAFSARVVEEYKRFLFLAMSAGHPVTPSDEVDQAWHLHLVYTRSYWDELCADVLRAPLHHGPTRGGKDEGAKFGEWYAKTRASYRRFFGEDAPIEVWPDAKVRFGEAPHFRRVNARRSWIIEKPQLRVPTQIAPALLVMLALLGAAGAALGAPVGWNVWNWNGGEFLALFWLLGMAGMVGVMWVRHAWALPADELPADTPLNAYALTRLQDNNEMPIDAALANMSLQGCIEVDKDRQIHRIGAAPTEAWERYIWDRLGDEPRDLRNLRSELMPKLAQFDAELERLGLTVNAENRNRIQWVTGAVGVGLLLLGGSKILVGLSRERPVGFLVVSCLIVLVTSGLALALEPRRSRRGEALLAHLRRQHYRGSLSLPAQSAAGGDTLMASGLVLGMALWGYNEMDAFGLSEQRLLMRPPATSGADSGSYDGGDSGDSGGDGGGSGCSGCGGCGGCGGG